MALDSSRSLRNALQELIRPTLVDYREAAVAKLPPHHALLGSLPRYSPLPGSTPDAVNATGHWDVATGMAVIDFTPSASASVVSYQLRYVPGPDYHTDDESIGQTISAGSPLHFLHPGRPPRLQRHRQLPRLCHHRRWQ